MKYNEKFLSVVVDSYLECAIWVRFDADEDLSIEDINTESLNKASEDCKLFLNLAPENNINPSQLGHDFWLTRNRHGAGFWDRYIDEKEPKLKVIAKELGDKLTKLCEELGENNIYLCDDGKVEIS